MTAKAQRSRCEKNDLTSPKPDYNPGWAPKLPIPWPNPPPEPESALTQNRGGFMSPLIALLTAWGVLTGILIVLLIYRSTLTMREDDQLYLSDSESHMQKEQTEILHKVNRLTPAVRWLGAASGLLILVIAGLAIYQGLNTPQ
jgi:hypothetical protein